MENSEMKQNRFVAYDYKEIAVEPGHASMMLDSYENFGWRMDGNITEKKDPSGHERTLIRMKRDRKIINKAELTRLQRNFEACIRQITAMEKSKRSRATVVSLIIGIIGTAFMAGSTFAVTAQTPQTALAIILAIPGLIGWIIPYFIYKSMVDRQTEKVTPLIEEKLDEIYQICEKGNNLLK